MTRYSSLRFITDLRELCGPTAYSPAWTRTVREGRGSVTQIRRTISIWPEVTRYDDAFRRYGSSQDHKTKEALREGDRAETSAITIKFIVLFVCTE
ncbi:hypothetical protein KIN20_013193 [Parelaphostrongylus tenuis]|uniref:Uncharacterized protein n=1 Tax=Parelaphostrongylus tenuis TaxID=148309 RepID=A0AAD5MX45_PARTN|nr:hypothetical protein KIN20_013193 [Parelaphostrongylus tenuis]